MSTQTEISPEVVQSLVERVDELEAFVDEEVQRISKELAQLRGRVHALEDGGADIEGAVDPDAIEDLQEEVEELRHVVNVDLDGKTYQQMTRDDKIREVQGTLLQEAVDRHSKKSAMNYSDVKWLFNGKPSTGHVYDLMQSAGTETGFEYHERDENNRIVVDATDVPDGVKKSLQVSRSE